METDGDVGMKHCQWKKCRGAINPDTGTCIMCGRSPDLDYELEVARKQNKYGLKNIDYGSGMTYYPTFERPNYKRGKKNAA